MYLYNPIEDCYATKKKIKIFRKELDLLRIKKKIKYFRLWMWKCVRLWKIFI